MFEEEGTKEYTKQEKPVKKDKPGKTEKKKLAVWKKILIGVLIAVLAVVLLGISARYIFLPMWIDSKINRPDENLATIPPEQEDFLVEESDKNVSEEEYPTLDPDDVVWEDDTQTSQDSNGNGSDSSSDTKFEIPQDKDIINILLIGQDRRPGQGRQRSDSMIIATLNKKNKTLKLTSLMRDMYVQIPGYSDNRINAAYAFGGFDLLKKTISKNFGLTVDAYIEVDFTGFTKIIDRIGGVNIALTQSEIDYLGLADAKAGQKYHLDGETALRYSRIRYLAGGDFKRTERQRTVLLAVFNKAKSIGLTGVVDLINELLPLLTTDLSGGKLMEYAEFIFNADINNLETNRIPVDGSYKQNKIRGMAVLVPNLSRNREALKEIVEG